MDMNISSTEQHLASLKKLPQADAIDGDDAVTWMRHVAAHDGERLGWHIKRAAGFGGSEAGTVLAWYDGEMKSRHSVISLVREKLLKRVPERANHDMLRGVLLEPTVRVAFEAKLTREGHAWKRREDYERRAAAKPPSAYPWMRANVDGIYEINGNLVVVDFKAPSENSLKDQLRTEGNDDYKVQLNHYCIVAEAAGLKVDALWIALYDYNRCATDGVQVVQVPIDRLMQQRLLLASTELWKNYVMRGDEPVLETRVQIVPTGEVPAEIEEAAIRAARAKILMKAADVRYEEARTEVADWTSARGRLGGHPMYIGGAELDGPGVMKVTAVPTLDIDAAVERLYEVGLDDIAVDELRKPGVYKDVGVLGRAFDALRAQTAAVLQLLADGKEVPAKTLQTLARLTDKVPARHDDGFNPEAVSAALVSCGEQVHGYTREVVSVILDRRANELVDTMTAEAEKEVEAFLKRSPAPAEEEVKENELTSQARYGTFG